MKNFIYVKMQCICHSASPNGHENFLFVLRNFRSKLEIVEIVLKSLLTSKSHQYLLLNELILTLSVTTTALFSIRRN